MKNGSEFVNKPEEDDLDVALVVGEVFSGRELFFLAVSDPAASIDDFQGGVR